MALTPIKPLKPITPLVPPAVPLVQQPVTPSWQDTLSSVLGSSARQSTVPLAPGAPNSSPYTPPVVSPVSSVNGGSAGAVPVLPGGTMGGGPLSVPNITPNSSPYQPLAGMMLNTGGTISPVKPTVTTPAPVTPARAPVPNTSTPVQSMTPANQNVGGGPVNPQMGAGGSSTNGAPAESPFRSAPPAETPEASKALELAEAAYAKSMTIGADELSTQEDLDKLIEATKNSYAHIQDQPVMLNFITGQMASVERRALNLAEPLERKLARLQAARQSSMEASKFALERADKAVEAKKNEQFTLGEGQTRYDAFGNVVATGPKKAGSRDTSLTEVNGQRVLVDNQTGQVISVLGTAKEGGTGGDALLSVTEAQALGVPYGTTKAQAMGLNVSGKPTEEQSKARQFAVAADNANNILASSTYNPGLVEIESMPNVFKSQDRQVFEQAARALVNATLRRESGATITDSEFTNKYKELIPRAGDGSDVLAQKTAARAAAVKSISEAGGQTGSNASGGADYAAYLKAIGQ